MRRILVATTVLAMVAAAEARPRLVCHDGHPDRAEVRGMKTGRRSYPFCLTDTVKDGTCRFSFCPDLGYVIGCNLAQQCAGHEVRCTDPGWEGTSKGDRFTIARGSAYRVERDISTRGRIKTLRITLLCR